MSAAAVVGSVGVAGAAERRQDVTVTATVSNTWAPDDVDIQTGETVTFSTNGGNGITHNLKPVEGDPADPNWLNFYIDYSSNASAPYTFTQPGTYTYLCQAHPTTMTGRVNVTGAPATPTPTPTQTATPTPTPTATRTPGPTPTATAPPTGGGGSGDTIATPPPAGVASRDTTAPAITGFRLRAVVHGTRVTFRLSEPAAVTIRVRRGRTTLRTARIAARAGKRSVTVRSSRMVPGRYRVQIEARDARGNRSRVESKNVRVKR